MVWDSQGWLPRGSFKKKTGGLNYRSYVVENQIEGIAHVSDLWWYSVMPI